MHPDYPPFADRRDAGRQLAAALTHLRTEQPVVLALPRGGVPVAHEVALALQAPMDVLLVRKIGAPGFAELGLGAVVEGDPHQVVLNGDLVKRLDVPAGYLQAEEQRQLREIARRREVYCGGRSRMPVRGRTAIVVDDGIATGGTMAAALRALAQEGAGRLIFAVPVAAPSTLDMLGGQADDAVCLLAPPDFQSVGQFYEDFAQTTDEEVLALLDAAAAASRAPVPPPGPGRPDPRASP
ncbi:phosphoribosyltransferase [Noviherbaspirillum aridicola]|uniref:Phosphoribosyltransferase n=1 Tax=Noviherbaspirillum aridicola TaxID=2849687 RepID=A0ABQ4Q9P5_9BURK|nr:phosphoribosyltransferase [Noviherbaspirillum aridicola]GIZ53941.1 phosphoribosyltransferase [Noviherbaspirillum aridicola]